MDPRHAPFQPATDNSGQDSDLDRDNQVGRELLNLYQEQRRESRYRFEKTVEYIVRGMQHQLDDMYGPGRQVTFRELIDALDKHPDFHPDDHPFVNLPADLRTILNWVDINEAPARIFFPPREFSKQSGDVFSWDDESGNRWGTDEQPALQSGTNDRINEQPLGLRPSDNPFHLVPISNPALIPADAKVIYLGGLRPPTQNLSSAPPNWPHGQGRSRGGQGGVAGPGQPRSNNDNRDLETPNRGRGRGA